MYRGPLHSARAWWRQPSRYDWLVGFVDARGYGGFTRFGVASASLAMGVWPLLLVLGPDGVSGPWSRGISLTSGVICLCAAVFWIVGWPTRGQSRLIVIAMNLGITANSLVYVLQDRSDVGLLASFLTASYVACVHTPRLLVAVLVSATVPIATLAVRTAVVHDDLALALANGLLQLAAVTVVPLTIQTLVRLLGDNAVVAHIDPLTELANRRGLDFAVRHLVLPTIADSGSRMSITMLDLDRFKAINDTLGHPTGDRVLITVGQILRQACPAWSAVARIGGEEFVVIAPGGADEAQALAARLRTELRATPWRLTASFGIAAMPVDPDADVRVSELTGHLIHEADKAMYVAKRAGGDRVELAS